MGTASGLMKLPHGTVLQAVSPCHYKPQGRKEDTEDLKKKGIKDESILCVFVSRAEET